jgi:hypothetical protein
MSQMILEYDEFCMFLLNIEVFNIMTPDFPYTSENETKCTILYFCMFYFHLFNVLFIDTIFFYSTLKSFFFWISPKPVTGYIAIKG